MKLVQLGSLKCQAPTGSDDEKRCRALLGHTEIPLQIINIAAQGSHYPKEKQAYRCPRCKWWNVFQVAEQAVK